MQPRNLVTLTGTVLNLRPVEIEPRPATDTAKAYAGGSYVEVTLANSQCDLDGSEVEGIVAYVSVRFNSDDEVLQELVPTATASLLCTTFVETYKVRGRWANSVGYRFSRLAAPIKAAPSVRVAS